MRLAAGDWPAGDRKGRTRLSCGRGPPGGLCRVPWAGLGPGWAILGPKNKTKHNIKWTCSYQNSIIIRRRRVNIDDAILQGGWIFLNHRRVVVGQQVRRLAMRVAVGALGPALIHGVETLVPVGQAAVASHPGRPAHGHLAKYHLKVAAIPSSSHGHLLLLGLGIIVRRHTRQLLGTTCCS